jgi:hypothetical protein
MVMIDEMIPWMVRRMVMIDEMVPWMVRRMVMIDEMVPWMVRSSGTPSNSRRSVHLESRVGKTKVEIWIVALCFMI